MQPLAPGYQIPNYWVHGYWQVGNQYWPGIAPLVVRRGPWRRWRPIIAPPVVWDYALVMLYDDDEMILVLE